MVIRLGAVLDGSGFKRGAREVESSARQAGAASRKLGTDLDVAGKAAKNVERLIKQAFGAAALIQGIRNTTRVIGDFESQITTLGGIVGGFSEEGAAGFAALTEQARELGATTSFSASQAAEGLTNLARAGFNATEAIEASNEVLSFAVAQNLELGQAAGFTAEAIRGFQLEAADASDVVNTLSQQANQSNTDVTLLASGLSFVAATASRSGSDLQETSAALGVLSDNAIKGSRAGTNLNQVFLKLAKPTDEAQKLIESFGISLDSINPEEVGLVRALENLEPLLQSNSDAATIFGARNAAAARILASNTDTIEEYTNANRAAAGVVEELAEQRLNTLNGRLDILKSTFEEVLLSTGDAGLTGALKSLVDALTDTVRTVDILVDSFGRLGDELDIQIPIFSRYFEEASKVNDALDALEEGSTTAFGATGARLVETERALARVQAVLDRDAAAGRESSQQALSQAENLRAKLAELRGELAGFVDNAGDDATMALAEAYGDVEESVAAAADSVGELEQEFEDLAKAQDDAQETIDAFTREVAELREEALGITDEMQDARDAVELFAAAQALGIENADQFAASLVRERQELRRLAEERNSSSGGGRGRRQEESDLPLDLEFSTFGGDTAEDTGVSIEEAAQRAADAQEEAAERAAAAWQNAAELTEDTFGGALRALEDDGKITADEFNDIAIDIINTLARIAIQQAFTNASLGVSGASGFSPITNADGGVLQGGSIKKFQQGGIIGAPVLFPLGGGKTGLAGEAGPEAILPLTNVGGRLGVDARGGGGTTIIQNITTPDADSFRRSRRQTLGDAQQAANRLSSGV